MAYRTCNAVEVISGIADLSGLDRNNVATIDFQQIRQSMDRRLQTAWEFDLWRDLEKTEKRYFRDLYSTATTYTASTATSPTEVYFPATAKYYQNVKGSTGVDPANASGVTNTTNWQDSLTSYSGLNFDATVTYSVGTTIYYPTTDRFYALHTSAVAGTLPTDTSKWGILTDFDRYVSYTQTGKTAIGTVLVVATDNPKTTTRGDEVDWWTSENGVQVNSGVSWVWIVFRLRTVRLSGNNFDASLSYVAGQQIYYASSITPGNFYDCVTTTNPADSPDSAAAKWAIVAIPLTFQRYLEMGGYADFLRNTGNSDKSDIEDGRATEYLSDQAMVLQGQEQQTRRIVVLSR